MQPIIYDVAISADGFIAGHNGDISRFPHEGPVVDDYYQRLKTYSVAIMGRRTYEFGYRFGLRPGSNPYPHMDCIVFSSSIDLSANSQIRVIRENYLAALDEICKQASGPIYLCGGGELAGWLCVNSRIERLRLKRAPILLGDGVRLFGNQAEGPLSRVVSSHLYEDGTLYQELAVVR